MTDLSNLERKMLECDKVCANHKDTVDKIKNLAECVSKTKDHTSRIVSLEHRMANHDDKMDTILTKLNLILGGILLSPFLVTVFMLLIKYKSK